jgi:hypothetical protein
MALQELVSRMAELGVDDLVAESKLIDAATQAYLKLNDPGVSFTKVKSTDEGADYGFVAKSSGKRPNAKRFANLLADLQPQPWQIKFKDISQFAEEDAKEVFLSAYDKLGAPADVWSRIAQRASRETVPGGILNLSNVVFVLRMSLKTWSTNIPMRMLKHYVDWHNGEDPFIQARGGSAVDGIVRDSIAAKRTLLLLQAAVFYESFNGLLNDAVWLEVLQFLLDAPDPNSNTLSKMSYLLHQAVFSMTPVDGSWYPLYNKVDEADNFPVFQGYTSVKTDRRDDVFYSVFQAEIRAVVDELADKFKLPLYAIECTKLITAPVTQDNIRRHMLLKAMFWFAGYSRGQSHIAHYKQYDEAPVSDIEAKDGEHPWRPFINAEYASAMRWAMANDRLPNWERFKRTYPTALKATAAGIGSVSIEMMLRGRLSQGKPKIKMSFSDKKIVGLSQVDKAFDYAGLRGAYTLVNPGAIGTREVPGGKNPRAIINVKLPDFNYTRAIGDALNDYVTMEEPSAPVGTSNDFVAGKEVGTKWIDDWFGAYASSRPDILSGSGDYSAYDATERFNNCRQYMLEGTVNALKVLRLTSQFGPVTGGYVELVETLWGQGLSKDAVFLSGRVPAKFFETAFPGRSIATLTVEEVNEKFIELNIKARFAMLSTMRSGELITLAANSLNNRANLRCAFEAFRPEAMSLIRLRLQGDDSMQQWRLVSPEALTVPLYEQYIKALSEVSGQNGLTLKKQKVTLRNFYSEFLQVEWMYGYSSPKAIIQMFASEKAPSAETNLAMMRSYAGKLATAVARGMDDALLTRICKWTWALKRSVVNERSAGGKEALYVPFASYYVPLINGGIGRMPFTVMGANVDLPLCIWRQKLPEVQRDHLDRACAAMAVKIPDVRKRVARIINSDSADVTPRDFMKPGRDFIRSTMLQRAVDDSKVAADALALIGVDLHDLRYDKYPFTFIDDALTGSKKLRELDVRGKKMFVPTYLDAVAKAPIKPASAGMDWIDRFVFEFTGVVEPALDGRTNPMMALKGIEHLYMQYGLANSRDLFNLRPAKLLGILRQDPTFRRDIRDETVIELLSKPRIMGDPARIEQVLVGIGARPDLAAQVALLFQNKAAAFTFKAGMSGVSLADPALGAIDFSREAHYRVVDYAGSGQQELDDIITIAGYAWSILESARTGVAKRVHVAPSKDAVLYAVKQFLGPILAPSSVRLTLADQRFAGL